MILGDERPTPEAFWAERERDDDLVRNQFEDHRVFEVCDAEDRSLSEWNLTGVGCTIRAVAAGEPVLVRTSKGRQPQDEAAYLLMNSPHPPSSWAQALEDLALGTAVNITVDSQPFSFTAWRSGDWTAVAGVVDDYTLAILVHADESPEIALQEVADIGPYLSGRKASIAADRGE